MVHEYAYFVMNIFGKRSILFERPFLELRGPNYDAMTQKIIS